jgi:hypothetical protein
LGKIQEVAFIVATHTDINIEMVIFVCFNYDIEKALNDAFTKKWQDVMVNIKYTWRYTTNTANRFVKVDRGTT